MTRMMPRTKRRRTNQRTQRRPVLPWNSCLCLFLFTFNLCHNIPESICVQNDGFCNAIPLLGQKGCGRPSDRPSWSRRPLQPGRGLIQLGCQTDQITTWSMFFVGFASSQSVGTST